MQAIKPIHERPERGGIGWFGQIVVAIVLGMAATWLIQQAGLRANADSERFIWWPVIEERTSWIPWIPVSLLVFWRWTWVIIHWARALTYRVSVFPRLRRAAEAAAAGKPVPELAVLAVTYKESPRITAEVFRSVFDELARVEGLERPAVIVAVTGSDEDDAGIRAARAEAAKRLPPERLAELVLLRGTDGKRRALAAGLEWIQKWQKYPADGAFIAMDGDTQLEPGALSRSLCFFRLEPKISAMTTNEHVMVQGPGWFSEWLHLRHGLRDLYASSISLSRRLLCLTGRFSIFRGDSLDDGFIEIVRADHVKSWLWGDYALLSGDDKSTWFHLLKQGKRMLYLPDVAVVTHEIVTGLGVVRAYHNLRRWGGNMIRNSERAIALGPRRLGFFTWWCLIDQRISMWTVLVGPLAVIMMIASGRLDLAAAYMFWVMVSRNIRVAPSWLHARRVSVVYAPLSAILDWCSAVVKIWVVFFPAKQFWYNRNHRSLDSTARSRTFEKRATAGSLMAAALVCLVAFAGWLTGTLQVNRDLGLMLDRLTSTFKGDNHHGA